MIDINEQDLQQIEGGSGYSKEFFLGVFVGYEVGAVAMVLLGLTVL